jgi:hypothetical protein
MATSCLIVRWISSDFKVAASIIIRVRVCQTLTNLNSNESRLYFLVHGSVLDSLYISLKSLKPGSSSLRELSTASLSFVFKQQLVYYNKKGLFNAISHLKRKLKLNEKKKLFRHKIIPF